MRKVLIQIEFLATLFCLTLSVANCRRNVEVPTADNSSELQVSPIGKDSAETALAVDSEDNIYVVYVEHGANKTADVFLQKFDAQAKQIGERIQINPENGQATAWRGDPPTIKIGLDDKIYIGWTTRVIVAEGSANDLFLSVSSDKGKTFATPVKINDDKIPTAHGMHSLAIDKKNHVYFAWLDERYLKSETAMPKKQTENNSAEMSHHHAEPNREVYFAVSNDGGKTFSSNKKLAENVCPCCKTSMITAVTDKIFISWRQVLSEKPAIREVFGFVSNLCK